METIQISLDSETKKAADTLFESLGFDTSTAIKMFITASLEASSFPFPPHKRHETQEIYDGHGSYMCEYGKLHDYSKINLEALENELINARTYSNLSEMWSDLDLENDDDDV